MAELITDEDEALNGLDPLTLKERRALVLEAGHVGDPEWASPAYNSANDPTWGATREAALREAS